MLGDLPPSSEGDVNVSPRRARWRAGLSETARALLEDDERYFLRQALSTPCLDAIVSAAGAVLTDVDGRRILDFHGNSVHQLGHGHPKVIAAVKAALDTLPFSPRRYTNAPAIDLARRLVEVAPRGLTKTLFAPSGAAAISMALKLARHATGRHKTLSMWDSFHGANLDTIGVGGEAIFRSGVGPMLPGAEHLPPLHLARRFFGEDRPFERYADYVDYALEVQGDVSALLAEPIRWTTVEAPPSDFWSRIKESCRRHGALLIFDEIPSGLARTGKMFACERFDVAPDILVLGKGLGGGIMPMAAILARGELDVVADGALGHYTHEKSPLGSAAALATLDAIAEEKLIERALTLEAHGAKRLGALQAQHSEIHDVRAFGAFFGVEIGGPATHDRADALLYACLERGLSFKLGGGNVITLCPPLTIPLDQFDRAFDILAAALVAA